MKSKEKGTLYRADILDDLLVFKATYHCFQFDKHAHDDFALGVMNKGVQKFYCRGEDVYAPFNSLITVNAGDIHDGMSADGNTYDYNIIYIPPELFQKLGSEMVGGRESHYFKNPVTKDLLLASQFRMVFHLLDCGKGDNLEVQSVFYTALATLLNRHGVSYEKLPQSRSLPAAVLRASEYINDMATRNLTLDEIADVAGLSRFHFLRVFNSSMGTTPHSYVLQRKLQIAKDLVRKGLPIADAALEANFSDQSHFTRKFKAAFGITPRQYQKAVC